MTLLLARTGETLARTIMLGLLVFGGVLLAPVIACWWIYAALKRHPGHVEPEYAVVE